MPRTILQRTTYLSLVFLFFGGSKGFCQFSESWQYRQPFFTDSITSVALVHPSGRSTFMTISKGTNRIKTSGLDVSGIKLWETDHSLSPYGNNFKLYFSRINQNDEAILFGTIEHGSNLEEDPFLLKIGPSGQITHTKIIQKPGNEVPQGLVVDRSNNLFIYFLNLTYPYPASI